MDFEIKEGEVFGFLGPSGAGKTTTQRLLIGLLRNYQWQIYIFDRERSNWGRIFMSRWAWLLIFPIFIPA